MIFMVEMKIIDDDGKELFYDGKVFGYLLVWGFVIVNGYFKGEGGDFFDSDNWFDIGDVVIIDEFGYMQIMDCFKDVIKFGGEWILFIDFENVVVGYLSVVEVVVIGVVYLKWDEWLLLIVVKKEGVDVIKDEIFFFMFDKIVKWWMLDDVVFVDEIFYMVIGKIQKMVLCDQFLSYELFMVI